MRHAVRFGVLRLTDSAPAILADAEGLFASEGVEVAVQVEPSWANIADKLCWGKLDAAIMLLPLALAAFAGLRGRPAQLIAPMGISQGGNSIVVSRAVADQLPHASAAELHAWLGEQLARPRFAVVHVYSMQNLLLRHWLSSAGVDPDRDLEIVVIPPERVVAELAGGQIAGFCAGAPWGDVAEASGAGRIVVGSSTIKPGHTEKCLALAKSWAAAETDAAAAVLRTLRAAQRLCDVPERAPGLAALLAQRLDLPEMQTRATLSGGSSIEHAGFAGAARLDPAELLWVLREMQRWGWLGSGADLDALVAGVLCSMSERIWSETVQ
jgi:two-component system, oxyanion-binding sensor